MHTLDNEILKAKDAINDHPETEEKMEQLRLEKKELEEEEEKKKQLIDELFEEKEEILLENRKKLKEEIRNNSNNSFSSDQIEKMSSTLKKIKDSLQSYFNNNSKLAKMSETYVDLLKRISLEKFNVENIRSDKNAHITDKFEDDTEQSARDFRERMRQMKEKFEGDNMDVEKAVQDLKEINKSHWKKNLELQNLRKTNELISSIIKDSSEEVDLTVLMITDFKQRIFEMETKIKDMEYALKK